ncbi:uncharacterized protein LOC120433215 [Oreochromis aureus]|uniref:uncharacterized protein LOC120433215 n=1 Tax=Oreochromis aureus TaxID=47969 RepID=UPI001953480F|nr:uncharacterized protein LOC120433215 [Oreochromis aureus]
MRQRTTMIEFIWIQMFALLLIQITATTSNVTSIVMKLGDDVTLLCLNAMDDQNTCNNTMWAFASRNKPTVELFRFGEIGEYAKSKSDRLSVAVNCSLVVKKLTAEDVGLYFCQQYMLGKKQAQHSPLHQLVVDLSLITLNEHKDNSKAILSCSVLPYEECHHTVKWLIDGQDMDKDNKEILTLQTNCSTTVSFPKSHELYSLKYNSVKCEVTDTGTGKVQQFTFISQQRSGQDTDDKETTNKPTSRTEISTKLEVTMATMKEVSQVGKNKTKNPARETESSATSATTTTVVKDISQDFSVSLRFIILSVGLAALLITAVTVKIWTEAKVNKTQMDKTTVHFDNKEDHVTIKSENTGDSATSI